MAADGSGSRINQQIEATADYYPPTTYAGLLNNYNGFDIEADPASGSFVPFTQVRRKNGLLFAIGLLPPASNVTGRLLDRTANIPFDGIEAVAGEQVAGAKKEGDPAGTDPVEGKGGSLAPTHRAGRTVVHDAFVELYGREPTLAELQYAQAVGWLETSYGKGWKKGMVGSNNWGAVQCGRNAQDAPECVEYEDSYPDGTRYKISFRTYKTPKDGCKDMLKHIFTYRTTGQSLDGGDVFRASYTMRRSIYYGGFCPNATKEYGAARVNKSVQTPDLDEATKACAQEATTLHAKRVKETIDDIAASCGDPWALGLGTYESADAWWHTNHPQDGAATPGGAVGGDAAGGDWKNKGSKDAQESKEQEAKLAGSPLLSTELGKRFLAAQAAQIKATQDALNAMANTPPLAMLVNPQSFAVKGEKIVTDGNWGRNGPIIEYWGDQQDKISASGRVGGFFALDAMNANGPGLTRWSRNFSVAWDNFMSLYEIYRSNGAILLPDDTTQRTRGNLSMLGSVYIYYDSTLYIGSFDSFTVTENDTGPHSVDYSFEFTVRAAFLLDQPPDTTFDYGAPQYFQGIQNQTPAPATAVYQPSEI